MMDNQVTGDITTNGDKVTLDVGGAGAVGLQIAGTWTGTITFECFGSTTGATRWEMFYFPLDDGASVVSA